MARVMPLLHAPESLPQLLRTIYLAPPSAALSAAALWSTPHHRGRAHRAQSRFFVLDSFLRTGDKKGMSRRRRSVHGTAEGGWRDTRTSRFLRRPRP
jgi:hypothetical protein